MSIKKRRSPWKSSFSQLPLPCESVVCRFVNDNGRACGKPFIAWITNTGWYRDGKPLGSDVPGFWMRIPPVKVRG